MLPLKRNQFVRTAGAPARRLNGANIVCFNGAVKAVSTWDARIDRIWWITRHFGPACPNGA